MLDSKPRFAMISTDIRRDLVSPLKRMSKLQLLHFYRQAPYNDLTEEDLDETLIQYGSPIELLRLLRENKPDIIQNVELFSLRQLPYVAIIYAYSLLRHIPLIAGVHISRPLIKKYGRVPAMLLRIVLQPVLHYTRLFFYLNNGGRQNLRWMGVNEPKLVRLMYGTWGIDPQEYTPIKNGLEPPWHGHPVALFIGRIHEEKGIFDLIEAYGRTRESFPDLELVFVGDGPHRTKAEQQVRSYAWGNSVKFLGTIKNRDLPAYIRAATIFVSPAITTRRWEEYVGMTNIQAMACGVPVISTYSGAIPEYVPDGVAGMLVPQKDPEALTAAMRQILADDQLRAKLALQGRAYAVKHYDAHQNVQKAEQVILDRCWAG